MNGSKTLEGFVPEYDATVVERILNHGARIVGNVTCTNLCLSGSSIDTTYGPVRNPWNKNYSAGGSSSGSGVVVFNFHLRQIQRFELMTTKRYDYRLQWGKRIWL